MTVKSYNNYKYFPCYILVILYLLTGSLSNLGAIDILAPQWIFLGSINILTCFYFLFFSGNSYYNSVPKLFGTIYIYIYIFYVLWNGLSYFYAVNPTETLINLPRIINTFFAIFFCYNLISQLPNRFNFVTTIFFLFFLAEMISYYYDLSEVYPKEGLRVIAIKGFAGNKNITAASIAFKIPFAIYLLFNSNKIIYKIIVFVTLVAGLLAISLIEARAAILSTIIVFSLCLVLFLFELLKSNIKFKVFTKKTFVFISPYLIAFVLNLIVTTFASDKYRKVAITDTIGNISFTEQSSNGRFNYWSDAFEYIKENPLLASGLGNWKIESIDKGKEHISGYTVPYHAHNDFIHVFAETGILGGISYLGLFILLIFYLYSILKRGYASGSINLKDFVLGLPIIVYGIDALLNFPVARPLMQSSFAIYVGLVLATYLGDDYALIKEKWKIIVKASFVLILVILIPGLWIHIISYKSLTQQGRLLYEFNNAQYKYTIEELDEIDHNFPNLTETAMPIKAMKARYYYLNGKTEIAHKMALLGSRDNPKIHFGDNLKSVFFLQENKIDSAYYYAKLAFDGLPNNMPHYDMYMRTLAFKKDAVAINEAFERIRKIGGDSPSIWNIYLRTLVFTRSLGDPFSMSKAQNAYNLYPEDENIFLFYRMLTYGQDRINKAEQVSKEAQKLFENQNFKKASDLYIEAFDKDPLKFSHALNAGLSFFRLGEYAKSIKYLGMATSSKKLIVKEKALRFKALSYFNNGNKKAACADFLNLIGRYPKRMYQQEFNKYCRGK